MGLSNPNLYDELLGVNRLRERHEQKVAELAAQDHPVLINLATVGIVFGVVAAWVGLVGVQSGNAALTAVSWVLAVLLGSSGLVALVKLHAARRVALTRSNLADRGDTGHGDTPRHATEAVLQHR